MSMSSAKKLNVFSRLAEPDPSQPAARLKRQRQALALIQEEQLVEAAYSYRIIPFENKIGEMLIVNAECLPVSRLIPDSGELTAVACGVCTLGTKLDQRISELFQEQRASLALELDRIGNELLFAVDRVAQDRILADVSRSGLTMAGELNPGDPGLDLDAQQSVLRLADAQRIGVTLGAGLMMHPMRSTSVVLGVGIDLPKTAWSRCAECPSRQRCTLSNEGDKQEASRHAEMA